MSRLGFEPPGFGKNNLLARIVMAFCKTSIGYGVRAQEDKVRTTEIETRFKVRILINQQIMFNEVGLILDQFVKVNLLEGEHFKPLRDSVEETRWAHNPEDMGSPAHSRYVTRTHYF